MNNYLLALILGIVEGLTEFLPVSSTAHIRISQAILQGKESLNDPFWKLFAVVIQLPAVIAVVVYFFPRIVGFVKSFIARPKLRHPVVLVMIATIVTAIPAAIAKKIIKDNLGSLKAMGMALLVGGMLMWAIDWYYGVKDKNSDRTNSLEKMTFLQSIWIGAVQILSAIFPGTSRSMSTIAAGQIAGLTRATALEFSFYVSIPIMFAAFLKDMKDSLKPGDEAYIGHSLTGGEIGLIAVGSITSFIVALAVIAWFMHWVRKHGFVPFAIYRIIVGVAVLVWAARV